MNNVKILLKVIIKKNNKILALKRSSEEEHRPGCWDLPGGKLEFGEKLLKCLKREVKEETSLKVYNFIPLGVITELDSKNNIFWVKIGYVANHIKGDVKISEEHTDFKWVTEKEFMKLRSASYLREFVKGMK